MVKKILLPESVIQGDTWNYTVSHPDYSSSEGWSCITSIKGVSGQSDWTGSESSTITNGFDFSVPPATTSTISPGTYTWFVAMEKNSDRFTVGSGSIIVEPDPFQSGSTDYRTHAEKMLAAIEQVLEGRASNTVLEYTILGRQLKYIPHTELQLMRSKYLVEVDSERRKKIAKDTCKSAGFVAVRFR